MPSSPRSLSVTEAYRRGMVALRRQVEQVAEREWAALDPDDVTGSFERWKAKTITALGAVQRQGVRLSAAYLGAFIATELGHRVPAIAPPLGPVGKNRDGRSLAEAYDSPKVAVLAALLDGKPVAAALEAGRQRAVRAVGLDSDTAMRDALTALMEADERIEGYRRAVAGTCAACAGQASNSVLPPNIPLQIHPGCRCVSEPVVRGARNSFSRPTGRAQFAQLAAADQDREYGPKVAELLRTGQVEPEDLVSHSRLSAAEDFITAASAEEALANAANRNAT